MRLASALLKQKGCVAVSGGSGNWDHLGWRREECEITSRNRPELNKLGRKATRRVECLWMNY